MRSMPNPIMDLMAVEGIAALGRALPVLRASAQDVAARGDALYGAWLCGTVLGNVGMALHHKLCHTLGGSFNLPHAETHTIVLPHALAYNAAAAPRAMERIAGALGGRSAAQAVYDARARQRRAGGAARHRHEGSRPRRRLRACAAEPVPESAPAGARRDPRAAAERLGRRAALSRLLLSYLKKGAKGPPRWRDLRALRARSGCGSRWPLRRLQAACWPPRTRAAAASFRR